jgi:hypothetical protein
LTGNSYVKPNPSHRKMVLEIRCGQMLMFLKPK